MAIERQAPAATAAKRVQKAADKPAPKKDATADTVGRLRTELATARRDHALEKLESPAKLRLLRRDLARALTDERAKQTKETK